MKPEITALIPIHRQNGNREWLQQTVNSLKGAEILVLENDGEISESFNIGLQQAETEWVLPFGADDLAHPELLEKLWAFTFNADLVYPGFIYTDIDLNVIGQAGPDPFCPQRLLTTNFIPGPSLIRKEKALQVGGFRELEALEDWDLWIRMHRAGARIKPAPGAYVFYRMHDQGRNARARTDPDYRIKLSAEIVQEKPEPLASFYAQVTPGTAYLRCILPARHLPGFVYPEVTAAFHPDLPTEFPDHSGVAIYQFPGDKVHAAAMQLMRQNGIKTLVEVDDNYSINPGKDILERAGWSLKIGGAFSSRQGHQWCAENADGVIVTTRKLAESYSKLNENVFICPNTVDPDDWPEPDKPDDGIFRIFWAASNSHDVDIPLVSKALAWASEQKGVEVWMAGLNPQFRFPYGYLRWLEDLDAYRAIFKDFDVGLAPIKRYPFALYRSDVKALEYAMGLCCPVLSDVEPYEDWVDEGNCLKAQDAKGFLKAIKYLVANQDEARGIAHCARAYTLAKRTIQTQITKWREAIATD